MKLKEYFSDFTGLFFPNICPACAQVMIKNEHFLCTTCLFDLPRTNFETDKNNDVAKIFWGRVPLENATAHFYFVKGGHIQQLLHLLKYKDRRDIGIELGKIMGYDFLLTCFREVEVVVPVPLHKTRIKKRGYNQSEFIAKGIAEVMKKPLDIKSLLRVKSNATQTKKHRYERWENVEQIFGIATIDLLVNKHILLVDDVITTGATLESCVQVLLSVPGIKISIAVVAMA